MKFEGIFALKESRPGRVQPVFVEDLRLPLRGSHGILEDEVIFVLHFLSWKKERELMNINSKMSLMEGRFELKLSKV